MMNHTAQSPQISHARKWGTLAIACIAMLLLALDLTVLHLAIPELTAELTPSATQVLWIADIYGFALAGLLVTMGNVGDRIGRKRLLLTGAALFGIASAVTAYASSAELLIAARALLGVAGATLMPSTLSIIRNVFTDPQERTTAVGIWSGIGAGGAVLGPIVGGLLLNSFWWGSVFLINLPVTVVIVIAGLAVLPESRNPNPGRTDLPSVVLSIVGIIAVIYAIKEAAHDGITQPDVIMAAAVGVTAIAVFAWRQTRLAEPLMDLRLFRHRAFSTAVVAQMTGIFAAIALSLVFAQYFQTVLGWSPLRSGLTMLPSPVGIMAGALLAPKLINAIGRARVLAMGLALAGAGLSLCTQIGVTVDYPVLIGAMFAIGAGMGFAMTVATDSILATVPKERAGAASAISETAYELGGAMGIAVLGSVLASGYRDHLRLPAGLPADAVAIIQESIGAALQTAAALPAELGGPVVETTRQAFVESMHTTALTGAGIVLVVAVVALLGMRGVPKVIDETTDETTDEGTAGEETAEATATAAQRAETVG